MIDVTKQPGINFDTILLAQEEFSRIPELPESIQLNLNMHSNITISNERAFNELNTLLTGQTDEGIEVFKLNFTFIGFFSSAPEQANMGLEEFMNNNSAALMFPYIREHVSSITMKSGMQPVILSPINVQALLNASREGKA